MYGGAWWATVHGVAKSQTPLRDFPFIFYFHALRKEMATHSSVLAWRIPGTREPGGLPSMGSHRVGQDWRDLAAAVALNMEVVGIFHSFVGLGYLYQSLWSVRGSLVSLWVRYREITIAGRPYLHAKVFVSTFLVFILLAHWKFVSWKRLMLTVWLSFY